MSVDVVTFGCRLNSYEAEVIRREAGARFVALARSPELAKSVSTYMADAIERLRPKTLRDLLETLNPDSAPRVKEPPPTRPPWTFASPRFPGSAAHSTSA